MDILSRGTASLCDVGSIEQYLLKFDYYRGFVDGFAEMLPDANVL